MKSQIFLKNQKNIEKTTKNIKIWVLFSNY